MNESVQPDNGDPKQDIESRFAGRSELDDESGPESFDDTGDLDEGDLDEEMFDEDGMEGQYESGGLGNEQDVRSLIDEIFEDELGDLMSELDVLTLEDAADYLKVEYGQIRKLITEQGLPGRKIGGEWRFLRGAIADWLSAPADQEESAPAFVREPEQQNRKPPLRERFAQEDKPRYPQQQPPQGSRYPQPGGRPPRQFQNESSEGGAPQQSYQPPRRPRPGRDQQQFGQGQAEHRPPRHFSGGQGQGGQSGHGGHGQGGHTGHGGQSGQGGFGNQGGGGGFGRKHGGGPKKPKRKALNEQRFKRLDRRKGDGDGPGDSNG